MQSLPDTTRLMAAIDATWPAAETVSRDGWNLRRGAGGGKRVSAASGAGDVHVAEAAMQEWGQSRLFQLTPEDAALDGALAEAGYDVVDPVALYAAPVSELVGQQSHIAAAYRCQFRPAITEEIWDQGGIGPARRAIMDRVTQPKMFLLTRASEKPAGVGFWAVDGDVAMIHAIEVLPALRRQGAGVLMIELAARLAEEQGASTLALAVTEANTAACALYAGMGMKVAGRYHYRLAQGEAA